MKTKRKILDALKIASDNITAAGLDIMVTVSTNDDTKIITELLKASEALTKARHYIKQSMKEE